MTSPVGRLPCSLRPDPAGSLRRVGRAHDGGYVLPEAAFAAADGLLSLGLNDDWSFDRDFARRHPGAPIIGYDPTIGRPKLLRRALTRTLALPLALLVSPRRSWRNFVRVWDACLDYGRFFGPVARHRKLWIAAATAPGSISLADALADSAFAGRDRVILKVDIEGAEYAAFAALPDASLGRVSLIAVELHGLDRHLADVQALARRLARDFAVAHVHANNYGPLVGGMPTVIEIVWARRSLLPAPPPGIAAPALPLAGLDAPNDPARPDIALSFAD